MHASARPSSVVVDADSAEALISGESVKILDASWHMPATKRKGLAEFVSGPRIEGAAFFDIDEASDKTSDLPHMLPSAQEFESYCSALGLSGSDSLLIYDTIGMFSAPRVWWMFRYFGHSGDLFVLNGGLPAWKAAGKAVEEKELSSREVKSGNYQAKENKDLVVSISEMQTLTASGETNIFDARAQGRFDGTVPDPRGARAGHMPNSACVAFASLLDENGKMKSKSDLKHIFQKFDLGKNTVTTCGSGVTACVVSLALHEIGYGDGKHQRVYDGSWAEWGAAEDTKVLTGG
eukprot:CAMPEP_0197526894 /NCGR_PEP_ID=MMETSP1318-20131121/19640_1 /TAXON_ID=552666 /ORGANISM="Partenskyella glossopodia, Strain RCC365" /LENGTH=291 /DNA_ID=CAMNT_0043081275 /DNA_START=57 /DNA_END=932 /DNA_ORIENTATION=+